MMKFDAGLPPAQLKEVPAISKAAEAVGFDALWTSETQHDPFLPCALIAEHTSGLRFGTAIAVSFARSPATLAYTAWDLAAQSGGRFILGLGTQVKAHIERRFGMPWPASPVGKLREQIEVLRAFWNCWNSGERLNYRGEYYKVSLMSPFFNPGPAAWTRGEGKAEAARAIPIYIAGVNTGMARLAGELCEGFHAHPFHSLRYLKEVIIPALAEGTKKGKRSRGDVAVSVTAFTATSPEEMNFARAQIAFYASTPSYRPVMNLHGWGAAAEQLSAHAARGEWAEMPSLITDEMLHEFCTVANDNDLAAALRTRYEGVADRLTLYAPFVPGERDAHWRKIASALRE